MPGMDVAHRAVTGGADVLPSLSADTLAEQELLELPGGRLRQLHHHLDPLGNLEAREMLAGEAAQLALVESLAIARDYERHGHLSPPLVGRADDGDLGHRRMRAERLLHLDG